MHTIFPASEVGLVTGLFPFNAEALTLTSQSLLVGIGLPEKGSATGVLYGS
jgi:hypothetical protein